MKTLLSILLLAGCSEPAAPTLTPDGEGTGRSRWEVVRASEGLALATTLAHVEGIGAGRGADVTSPREGRLRRLLVAPGDEVAAGDPIAEVSSPALAVAAAELRGARGEEEILQARVERLETLTDEGLARADDLLDARRMLASVRSRRATADALLRSAAIGSTTSLSRGYVVLHSPVEGVVQSVSGRIGSPVVPNAPIARIAGVGPVRVVARTPSTPPEGRPVLRTDDGDVPLRSVGRPVRDDDGLWLAFFEPTTEARLRNGEQWPLVVESDGSTVSVPASSLTGRSGRNAAVLRRRDGETGRIDVQVEHVDGARASVRGDLRASDEVAVDPALVFEDPEALPLAEEASP